MTGLHARIDEADKAALDAGTEEPSAVVRQLIRWYLRRPGARLPARPAACPPDSGPPADR